MQVMVEGVITSIEQKTKEEKKSTELLLAQKGEKVQVAVRLPGHQAANFEPFQIESFKGRLLQWRTRDGIGSMVVVGDDE